jgi:hypothetical protein
VSYFSHIKIVPKAALALWCEFFIKALNGLSDAIDLAPTQDAACRLIIRRAFLIMRCTAFLGGDYGALLNKWETNRKKVFCLARKQKPEDERAAHEILAAKPHCIRRGAARILGHGMVPVTRPQSTTRCWRNTRAQSPMRPGTRTNGPPMIPMKLFGNSSGAHGPPRPVCWGWPHGVHAHYVTCLNRARTNGLATAEGAGVQLFHKLGELVLGNACP